MLHPTPPRVRIIQGATMASDPSLPTSECRLSGVGESTMGLGRWSGPCREWSGPRVQGREMWGATHSCWQKWLFYCAVSAHNTEAQGPTPQTAGCPAWGKGRHFASEVSYCMERSKEDQRAEMAMSNEHPHARGGHLASASLGR